MLRAAVGRVEMSRREAWLSAAAVFLVALAVRIVAARSIAYPVPEDTAYYVDVAGNLVRGHGLTIDAIWSYQTPPLTLPRDAFEVWLPLPSLLAAIPMAVLGAGFRSAQVASVVAGALLAVLTWRLAADVAEERSLAAGRARTLAIGSGLVAGVIPVLVVYSALPDSSVLFADLALASCILMTRIVRAEQSEAETAPRPARRLLTNVPLLTLGFTLGLAALCRSEFIWLALAWLAIVWFRVPGSRPRRLALLAIPGIVAAIVFAPWVVRDWVVFGRPMPGQTLANAFSVTPFDIYAYRDPPTLQRYLAEGPGSLFSMRVTGTLHNLVNVLLLPALPTGALGLASLPLVVRIRALAPMLLFALASFLAASLVFPVATTWGTFLHSSLAIDALLVVATLVGLDSLIAKVGRFRGWTRPVAWLGPALAIAVAVPLLAVSVTTISRSGDDTSARYGALPAALAAAESPLDGSPVIADHPIWFVRETGAPSIALPNESPESVLDLARRFGAHLLVVEDDGERTWPGILKEDETASRCFEEVHLGTQNALAADTSRSSRTSSGQLRAPLAKTRVFRIVCA